MKKSVNVFKWGLFLFLVLAVMLISRCVKDPTYDSTYTITATSVGIGGIVSPSTLQVAKGESASVTLKPDSGYDVDVVKVDGNIEPIPTNLIYTFTEVIAKHELVVTFKKAVVVTHNVEVLPTTGGSVTPSGITQIADGLGINFTFTPDHGFAPDSIVVNGKSFPLTGNTYTLSSITSDTKVQVVFKKTLSWYLMQVTWKQDSIAIRRSDGLTWDHYLLWGKAGEHQNTISYLPTGRIAAYVDGKYVGDSTWKIDETVKPATLNVGGFVYNIDKLDSKNLILSNYSVPTYNPNDGTWSNDGADIWTYSPL